MFLGSSQLMEPNLLKHFGWNNNVLNVSFIGTSFAVKMPVIIMSFFFVIHIGLANWQNQLNNLFSVENHLFVHKVIPMVFVKQF